MKRKNTVATFSPAEKQAIKDRATEAKTLASAAAGLDAFMEKVNEMPASEAAVTLKIRDMVSKHAPELVARTWYGMPAFYTPGKQGKVIIFYQNAAKFKTRLSTLGFSEHANLDNGDFFATSYALVKLTPKVEAELAVLIKKAVS